MRGLFVTGTDTGVGKTAIVCALIQLLQEAGLRVGAYKPVCSGAELEPGCEPVWDDLRRISAVLPGISDDLICPQRFLAPLAPPRAAALESREVNETLLWEGLQNWNRIQPDLLLVEGAGGLLSPLSENLLNRDLAVQFGFPLLIVARAGLGTINQTLMTIETARSHRLSIAGVLLNQPEPVQDDRSLEYNARDLQKWTDVPIWGPLPYSHSSLRKPLLAAIGPDFPKRFDVSRTCG